MTARQKLILWAWMELVTTCFENGGRSYELDQIDTMLVEDGYIQERVTVQELRDIVQILKADLKPSMGHD